MAPISIAGFGFAATFNNNLENAIEMGAIGISVIGMGAIGMGEIEMGEIWYVKFVDV